MLSKKRKYENREKTFLKIIEGYSIVLDVFDNEETGKHVIVECKNKYGHWLITHNYQTKHIMVSYDRLWTLFEIEYKMPYSYVKTFMDTMIAKHLKINGSSYTPHKQFWD